MHITYKTLIKDIQKEFNARYPSLWIDFYSGDGGRDNLFLSGCKLNPDKALNGPAPAGLTKVWDIDIDKDRTVAQVKTEIRENFGLRARLLRRIGNVWVGISLTDDWTLERQNAAGDEILWGGTWGNA
ncbi:hypothetical protein V9K67_15290 [Paraflavisolibacter sp. H34]|uniref:hypothetical protein n=1 Tax=Huijunlia imazamoxiresistens TaxID=3127457 RepID=UPI0030195FA5